MSSAVLMLHCQTESKAASDHPTPFALVHWAYQTSSVHGRTPVLVLPRGVTLSPRFFAELVKAFSNSWTSSASSSTSPKRLTIELCTRRGGLWSLVGLAGLIDNLRLNQARQEMMQASSGTNSSIIRCLLPSRPALSPDTLVLAIAETGAELPAWTQPLELTLER